MWLYFVLIPIQYNKYKVKYSFFLLNNLMQGGGSLKSHRSVLTPRSTLVCPSQFLGGFSFVLYVAFIIPCFGFCFFFRVGRGVDILHCRSALVGFGCEGD